MISGLYKGYSTYEYQRRKTFTLTDMELVKMDLLSHIYTRKGERVMMPAWGTRIPELAFEPLDQITLDILEEDLRAVVAFDPRVKLMDLTITPSYDNNSVIATVQLLYVELNIAGNLDINITFEQS